MQGQSKAKAFWPNGARLAISISLMFEGGGLPISGAGGPISEPIKDGVPDLPTNAFFAYGHYEGIPRVLNLLDKHKIKASCFMIGKAIEQDPDLAREIVRVGTKRRRTVAPGRIHTIFRAKKRSGSSLTRWIRFLALPVNGRSDGDTNKLSATSSTSSTKKARAAAA